MTYQEKRDKLLTDPAATFWLKAQIKVLEQRDCVDAEDDLIVLTELTALRIEEAQR